MFSEVSKHIEDDEELIETLYPSRFGKSYFKKYFLSVVLTILTPIFILAAWFYNLFPFNSLYLLVLFLIALKIFMATEINRVFTMYHITDKKLIVESGVFGKKIDTLYYSNITHTVLDKSFEQRIFDVGDVKVAAAGEDGMEIEFKGLKDPSEYKSYIDKRSSEENKVSNNSE